MNKLKAKELKQYRVEVLADQEGICELCGNPLNSDEAVLDHDHYTGQIRGALHRGCNALLGRIENNCRRHLIPLASLADWLFGASQYLKLPQHQILHPTHKTEEEKKIARNKKVQRKESTKKKNNEHRRTRRGGAARNSK